MSKVYQWKCPLESCNHEQGLFQQTEEDCANSFTAHLNGHAVPHFVPYVFAGKWHTVFTLTAE